MNLKELLLKADYCGLNGKQRFTSQTDGYASMEINGDTLTPILPDTWSTEPTGYGLMCKHYSWGRLFALDFDFKDNQLMQELLNKYPTLVLETKHGYHAYFLSEDIIKYSCKSKGVVDFKGITANNPDSEGGYCKLHFPIKVYSDLPVLPTSINAVIELVYNYLDLPLIEIGEYSLVKPEKIAINTLFDIGELSHLQQFLLVYFEYTLDWKSHQYSYSWELGKELAKSYTLDFWIPVFSNLLTKLNYKRKRDWLNNFATAYSNGLGFISIGTINLDENLASKLRLMFDSGVDPKAIGYSAKDIKLYQLMKEVL